MATRFHSRADWGARPPVCSSTNFDPEGDTVHYGGPSPWGSGVDRSTAARFQATADHNRCAPILRAYQDFHMDVRGLCDLAYSSAACPHGHRYEGRGVGLRTGAQGTNDGNNRSYATVYIAGDGDPLTDDAKRAFLDEGSRFLGLRWGHRDWKPTACPGDPLYAWRSAGFPAPPEDDMSAADVTAIKKHIDLQLSRVMSWLATGGENAFMSGAPDKKPWIRDPDTRHLRDLADQLDRIEANPGAVDPAALAAALAPLLPALSQADLDQIRAVVDSELDRRTLAG